MGVLYLAEVVALGETAEYLGTHGRFSGDDEVGMSEEDLGEGGAVVEA